VKFFQINIKLCSGEYGISHSSQETFSCFKFQRRIVWYGSITNRPPNKCTFH